MRLQAIKLGLLSVLLFCAGCANKAAPIPSAGTADWRIALSAKPAMPHQLDPTQFQVKITDVMNKPVTGANVIVQLAMPTMDMGQNQVTARAEAPGVYTASGRFTMPGTWQIMVQANKGAAHQTQSFPIRVQ